MIKQGTLKDFAVQEIIVDKELPKTLEEFAIKEIQDLREENKKLINRILSLESLERLVENIKRDFKPTHNKPEKLNGFTEYIRFNDFALDRDKIDYYKKAFQLEECEEDEPEKETIKS